MFDVSIKDLQIFLEIYEETKEDYWLAESAAVWLIYGGEIYPVPAFLISAWRFMQKPQN